MSYLSVLRILCYGLSIWIYLKKNKQEILYKKSELILNNNNKKQVVIWFFGPQNTLELRSHEIKKKTLISIPNKI